MTIYSAFDTFCKTPTWDTSHYFDEARFDASLSEVIHEPDFSPEAMGEYIRANHMEPIWPKSEVQIDAAIARWVDRARAALTDRRHL